MIWHNDRVMPAEQVRIAPDDRGLTLGDGLFETIRCRGGAPMHVSAHLARLAAGTDVLGIPLPLSMTALAHALVATLEANGIQQDGVLRLTLTRGSGARGLLPPMSAAPTLLITASDAPPPAAPVRVVIATSTCRNQLSPLSLIKSLNYLDNILARVEAGRMGADDALLLNTHGLVAEASAATLFAVVDGILVTPPIADGALPGVMRHLVAVGLGACERSLTVADLECASELFLTNSLGIRSVIALEGQALEPGRAVAAAARLNGD